MYHRSTVLLSISCWILLLSIQTTACRQPEAKGEAGTSSSPRIAILQEQLQQGKREALRQFWAEVEQQGTPLLEPIPGDEQNMVVTFLWRSADSLRNVVVFLQSQQTIS